MTDENPNIKGSITKADTASVDLTERERQIIDMIVKGLSSSQMAERIGVKPSSLSVKDIIRKKAGFRNVPKANLLFENWKDVEEFEIEADLLHHGLVKSLEKITRALSLWDDASLDWLAKNLESGALEKIRHSGEASDKPASVSSAVGSAWVAIDRLPPELANARREAETARKRSLRAQMSEDEKAEQRAKNASRMREKRRNQPQP